MAAKTGIALPFQGTGRGRLKFATGDDQLRKIILLNLADLESDNPFQDLGLGGDLIFALNNDQLKSELRRRIVNLFKRLQLEDRARLVRPPVFTDDHSNQVLDVFIEYVNIQENKAGDVQIKFSSIPDTSAGNVLINNFI